jgi:hypothetical protein
LREISLQPITCCNCNIPSVEPRQRQNQQLPTTCRQTEHERHQTALERSTAAQIVLACHSANLHTLIAVHGALEYPKQLVQLQAVLPLHAVTLRAQRQLHLSVPSIACCAPLQHETQPHRTYTTHKRSI